MRIILSLIMFFSVGVIAVANGTEDTMTGIFHPDFRSLQVTVDGNEQSPPIISLDSGDRVIVSFDELADDRRYMRYSLVHCNADWQPSALVEAEYVDGFNIGDVEEYDYSQGTSAHYVHYSVTLPNRQVKFTVSGNYLLRVFPEDNPDEILLQARFSVNERSMKVSGDVTSRTDVDYNDSHQQVSVTVDADRVNVHDMFNDLKVVVTQNGRCDNSVMVTKPLRISGKIAYFEHLRPLVFDAGNEYRRMETVSTSYPGMGVAEISFAYPYYHIGLITDEPRYGGSYLYDRTQFGRFKIREYNSSESDIQADYVVTHFSLKMPELHKADVFLDGDFTGRRFDPDSRMIYNRMTGMYEKSLLLKQGAYNYQYIAVPFGSMKGNTVLTEGNFYQTINEYVIKVYHRPPGSRYDRLVGAAVIYSGR